MTQFTQDDLSVRLTVNASFSITLGVYDGPLTREVIGQNLDDIIASAGGIADYIDRIQIDELTIDDGQTSLVDPTEHQKP